MSATYVAGLGAVVATLVGLRLLLRRPLPRLARPVSAVGAAVGLVGVAGLAFHCGAMFFPRLVRHLPGATSVMPDIRALGLASVVWYVVPCLLVLVALRRQHPVVLAVLVSVLAAVGVTMYDGGRLDVHLTAIFAAVVALSATVTGLVVAPSRDVAARS